MQRRSKIIAAGVAVAALAAGGAGVAVAAVGDDDGDEVPITGEALERATTVALDHLGGGTVTETEEGDEDSYYEVEVTLDDGSQVDVQLDEDFNVVSSEGDDESDENDTD